jgi:4-hydroxybenzoate polyprenyltransferase
MTTAAAVPAWRVYLALGRVSNLPTVWTNCAAGAALASGAVGAITAWAALAISLFYTAGMYLNDAFDAEIDRRARPERPIPRGLAAAGTVRWLGSVMLAAGAALLFAISVPAGSFGLLLAALIVYYNWRHKRDPLSPLVMALCRGCVYFVAAAAAGAARWDSVAAGAAALTLYVAGLSQAAKYDVLPGRGIAMMIAGISLLDAAMVLVSTGHWGLASVTALGFPLTLALQRLTPGT